LIILVVAIVIVAGVIIAVALLVAVIATTLIAVSLLVAVITATLMTIVLLVAVVATTLIAVSLLIAIVPTAAMPLNGLMVAIVIAPAGLGSRLRARLPATAVLTITAGWNVKDLSGINVIRIGQTIGPSNFVRVYPKSPANGIQGITIVDGIVETTAPTTAAIAATITRLRFTLGSYSQL